MTDMRKTSLEIPPEVQSRESSNPNSRTNSRASSQQSQRGTTTKGKMSSNSARRTHSRRKSSKTDGGQCESYVSDDEGSNSEEIGEYGFPKNVEVQICNFVYSAEVREAMHKLRVRREQRNKFKKSEVHIFHLTKIIHSGTLPFVPSATFVRSVDEAALPEPGAVPTLPRIRRRTRTSLLIDQTLDEIMEERHARRDPTPMSMSFTKSFAGLPKPFPNKTSSTTPQNSPRTTTKNSSSNPPMLATPLLTPMNTPKTTPKTTPRETPTKISKSSK